MKSTLLCALLVFSAGAALAQPRPAKNDANQEMAAIDKVCQGSNGAVNGDRSQQFSETIAENLSLNDDQKKALQEYKDAQAKAIADARTQFCANKPDLSSLEGGLKFREKMLEGQLATVRAVNPRLIAFYNSLNAEQKAKFDGMRETMVSHKHEGAGRQR